MCMYIITIINIIQYLLWHSQQICLIKFNCTSMLHIPIMHAHDISKQIPQEKNFPPGWKYYKTIGSYAICAFIDIWSTWEVWRVPKKLELLSATPWATLMHLLCSPNFPCASYLNEHTLMYEPIVSLFIHRNNRISTWV